MKPFVVKNAAGEVMRYGHAPDDMLHLQAMEGETVEEGEYVSSPVDLPPLTYAGLRSRDYPSVGDQLDALWTGGEALISMQQKIFAVKAAHPKEEV